MSMGMEAKALVQRYADDIQKEKAAFMILSSQLYYETEIMEALALKTKSLMNNLIEIFKNGEKKETLQDIDTLGFLNGMTSTLNQNPFPEVDARFIRLSSLGLKPIARPDRLDSISKNISSRKSSEVDNLNDLVGMMLQDERDLGEIKEQMNAMIQQIWNGLSQPWVQTDKGKDVMMKDLETCLYRLENWMAVLKMIREQYHLKKDEGNKVQSKILEEFASGFMLDLASSTSVQVASYPLLSTQYYFPQEEAEDLLYQ